ncbi:MAG: translation initiation factor IF-2 [Candidatus Binataceae bacterium]|jgi:translation initiation factor IF-2
MARKRIKTLAHEWNVPVEDVLATCERLKLAHAHSDSSLLGHDEADRVKANLDEQANRAAILRRETVLETTAGKVVEKRLNATVMRRRHAEPEPGQAMEHAAQAGEPFHFEVEESREEGLVAPFLEAPPPAEPETPLGLEVSLEVELPATNGEVAAHEASPTVEAKAQEELEVPQPQPLIAEPEGPVEEKINGSAALVGTQTVAPPIHAEAAAPPQAKPIAQPRVEVSTAAVRPRTLAVPGRVINLTSPGHAAAPRFEESAQSPKVLGKIDLRKPPARPAAPPTRPAPPARPGVPGRPAPGPRFARPGADPAAPMMPPATPPTESLKPGARAIKKKRVVKKDGVDLLAEREMRGARFPKKRRALPGKEQRKTEITTPKASKRVVRISEGVTVGDLARNMGVKAGELIRKLMTMGVMSTMNQVLDPDTAALIANEFGYNVENVAFDVESAIEEGAEEQRGEPIPRPPVVTVMGHVDHGKTSLLDAIRHTEVTADEFGGITQHIGAYSVSLHGRSITFVDTPGHEAFTAMRARGAKVTDIVVLVVAADEGIMPQTIEALNHAKAAKVPIVVAINKIDRPEANIERVKQQLSEQGLIPEDYGGETITVPVSARTGEGVDRLLEMILLQADVLELKAPVDRLARGAVVESQLDRGRGPVATVLIQEGVLHQGDPFVCGIYYGRVRAMLDHHGQKLAEAGPATPVEIFGLSGVPEPGTAFVAVGDESKARQIAEFRQSKQREGELQKTSRVSLEELSQKMRAGEVKELKVIVKGDVQGSVEALSDALRRLSAPEAKLEVIHASAGGISETDVTLASASGAIVIGFNVRPEPKAASLAEAEGVDIRLYTIIYEAINEAREALEGLLAPTYREKALGRAEVRQTFNVSGSTVAGSMVLDGKLSRGSRARLVRDSRVVWEGKIGSLRRFKDDAREVLAGYECGVGLENFNDIKPGDVVETFEMEAVARKLVTPRAEPIRGHAAAAEKQI